VAERFYVSFCVWLADKKGLEEVLLGEGGTDLVRMSG